MFPNTKTLPAPSAAAKNIAQGLSVCQMLSVVSPKATAERRPSRLPVPGLVSREGKLTAEGTKLQKALAPKLPAAYKLDPAPKRSRKAKTVKAEAKS